MKKQVTMEELMPLFREQLESGRKIQFTITGNSMRPMLDHKVDQVFLEKVTKDNVKKWDVVLFKADNGAYILHRVIALDGNGFVTRGDNNYRNDKWQSYDALLGKVYKYEHKGKTHEIGALSYKVYVVFWMMSYGIRKFMMRVKNKLKSIIK